MKRNPGVRIQNERPIAFPLTPDFCIPAFIHLASSSCLYSEMKEMLYRIFLLGLVILATSTCALAGGDDAPAWLQQAAAAKVPAYEKDVPAVVLYNEQSVSVGEDGRVVT